MGNGCINMKIPAAFPSTGATNEILDETKYFSTINVNGEGEFYKDRLLDKLNNNTNNQ